MSQHNPSRFLRRHHHRPPRASHSQAGTSPPGADFAFLSHDMTCDQAPCDQLLFLAAAKSPSRKQYRLVVRARARDSENARTHAQRNAIVSASCTTTPEKLHPSSPFGIPGLLTPPPPHLRNLQTPEQAFACPK